VQPGPGVSTDRSFGDLLCAYRRAAGLTQEQLAGRAGLSSDAVSLLERGVRTSPRASTVALLARALALTPPEQRVFAAAARHRQPRRATTLAVPPALRAPSTPFVGREWAMARARGLLAAPDVRLVTLTGSPGAGKTRLALELVAALGDRYRDGVVVVSLAPIADAALVMPAIRQALGLREAGSESPRETVARHCSVRHLLLVVDNFEHLLAAGPELVELLGRCPGLQVLATSRAALRVRVEHELEVPPLRLPTPGEERRGDPEALRAVASVTLFLGRAAAATPGFELTEENAQPVATICRRLDGLPLALELAAPWVRLLPPRELLSRLDHRLELLVDGPRDLPERQRTMRATLRWSCDLLAPEPRALLRRLSVFAGSASLDALEDVCLAAGPLPGGVLHSLAALADHGLVRRVADQQAEGRVTMLETVREFGRELLEEDGELAVTAGAHLDRYTRLGTEAQHALAGPAQGTWMERLSWEHDNVRAALRWAAEHGPAEMGLRLAAALHQFWLFRGHNREGLAVLERLLSAGGPVDPAVRAAALRTAGTIAWRLGSDELAVARLRESVAIFRQLGDARGLADALRGLGPAIDRLGDHDASLALFEEAVSLLRGLDDPAQLAAALMYLGVHVGRNDDATRSTVLHEEALTMFQRLDDALSMAMCLVNLGNLARVDGDLGLARARLEEAAAIARRLDAPVLLAASLEILGSVARTEGDPTTAGRYALESLRVSVRLGERQNSAVSLRSLAWVAWTGGEAVRAARLYGAAHALCPVDLAPDQDEQATHAGAVAALRETLGDAFAAAHESGGRLTLEAAAAVADPSA
jgi:predicted ATPase/transcriptional regulator with XRE-family HTH domain